MEVTEFACEMTEVNPPLHPLLDKNSFLPFLLPPTHLLNQRWDVDGRHVKPGLVQSWSLAELLRYLHQNSLSVRLCASCVCLGQIEPQTIRMLLTDPFCTRGQQCRRTHHILGGPTYPA